MPISLRRTFSLLALALFAATPASAAQHIINGDFEMVDGRVGVVGGKALDSLSSGRWDVYDTLPGGWHTTGGAGIEVEYSGTVVNAYSGNHYVELDSHPGPNSNSSMSLDLVLDANDYELSFMYFPRTSVLGDNGIRVLFDDVEVLSADDFRQPGSDWTRYAIDLLGVEAGIHTLTFSAFGIENTLGGFIDKVSLESPGGSAVPEPTAALVYSIGLAVFAANRKRTRA